MNKFLSLRDRKCCCTRMKVFMFIEEVWHIWESKIISHYGKYNNKIVSKHLLPMRMLGLKKVVRGSTMKLWNYTVYLLETIW